MTAQFLLGSLLETAFLEHWAKLSTHISLSSGNEAHLIRSWAHTQFSTCPVQSTASRTSSNNSCSRGFSTTAVCRLNISWLEELITTRRGLWKTTQEITQTKAGCDLYRIYENTKVFPSVMNSPLRSQVFNFYLFLRHGLIMQLSLTWNLL